MPGRRAFLGSLLGLLPAAAALRSPAKAATVIRYPYLQNVGPGHATILWTTVEEGQGAVRYSTDRSFARSASGTARELTPAETELHSPHYRHRVELLNLEAGTRYYYRVYTGSEQVTTGDDLSFRTAGPGPFTFLAFGDSGSGSAAQRQLAAHMLNEAVSLVVHTGDIAYPKGSFQQYEDHHFAVYRDLMKRVPFFPCPGNHAYWTSDAFPYLTVHEVPTAGVPARDQGRYYSFDWSNVHFVALDSNRPLQEATWGRGAMLQWLEEDLLNTRKFWKIVYFHHPPYAWGPNEKDPYNRMARDYIVPILERHGVQLVLNGHEHSYQRSHPIRNGEIVGEGRGIVYITTGGGGGGLYPVHSNPLLTAGASVHHYVRLTVEGSRITAVAVDLDGNEIDRCVVAPSPGLSGGGVVNAASFLPQVAPGTLVSIFGENLAPDDLSAGDLPLPLELGGIRVRANGKRIPLLFVSPTQINAQLPFDLDGWAEIAIETPNGTVETGVALRDCAPGILAIAHPNGRLVCGEAPAEPGCYLTIYATGLGAVNGPIQAGQPASGQPLLRVTRQVAVDIGGVFVEPSFAGLAPGWAGVYQVDFQAPKSLRAGRHTIRLRVAEASSNPVTLAV